MGIRVRDTQGGRRPSPGDERDGAYLEQPGRLRGEAGPQDNHHKATIRKSAGAARYETC
jgi:hypothetical protein